MSTENTSKEKILTGVALILAGAFAGALLCGRGGIHINIGSFNRSENMDGTFGRDAELGD